MAEFCVVHRDGSISDAELHEPILAAGDSAAVKEATRQRLRARGWAEAEIESWLDCVSPD